MIIFGERINGMYRDVRTAIVERDKTVIQTLAQAQLAGGADVMDLNVGPAKGDAVEHFVWLAQTVHEITDKPLSLDSAKADLLVQVVPRVKRGPARHQAGHQFLHGGPGLHGQAGSLGGRARHEHHRPDHGSARRARQRGAARRVRRGVLDGGPGGRRADRRHLYRPDHSPGQRRPQAADPLPGGDPATHHGQRPAAAVHHRPVERQPEMPQSTG